MNPKEIFLITQNMKTHNGIQSWARCTFVNKEDAYTYIQKQEKRIDIWFTIDTILLYDSVEQCKFPKET